MSSDREGAHGVPEFHEGEEAPPPGVRTMAGIRWALVAAMTALAVFSFLDYFGALDRAHAEEAPALYVCPMHPQIVQDHPGTCPICNMSLVLKAAPKAAAEKTVYTCAMHPDVVSDVPGVCPICNMVLEKRTVAMPGTEGADEGHDEHGHSEPPESSSAPPDAGSKAKPKRTTETASVLLPLPKAVPGLVPIELSRDRIQLSGLKTAKVTKEKLRHEIRTVGFVAPSEDRVAMVHTRFAGWIEELLVARTGERVSKGRVLATIYSPELLTAQHEFLNAKRWEARSKGDPGAGDHPLILEDARRRLELLGVSPEEIDELERTGKPMHALKLRSPVSGHVTKKSAVQGLYVQPGTELFEVADLSTVWVLADVYENEVARVREGQRARLKLTAYSDREFSGRVDFIYPVLDPASRTLRLRVIFPNAEQLLKPGMYGEVLIGLAEDAGLLVPREALVDTGELQYVFLARPGGRFEPRRVRVGPSSGEKIQILEGVELSDVVVTTANFLLDSESRLQAALSAKSGAESVSTGSRCDLEIDRAKYPEKHKACLACETSHRGMGTMEEDCKKTIPEPWR